MPSLARVPVSSRAAAVTVFAGLVRPSSCLVMSFIHLRIDIAFSPGVPQVRDVFGLFSPRHSGDSSRSYIRSLFLPAFTTLCRLRIHPCTALVDSRPIRAYLSCLPFPPPRPLPRACLS